MTIAAMKQKEVILQVTPKTTGQLEIQRVEWELFDIVRGCHSLERLEPVSVGASRKRPGENDSLKFKVIEESGEIEANLTLQFRAPTEAPMEEIERLARSHCEADRSALGLPPLSHARPVRCTIVHEP